MANMASLFIGMTTVCFTVGTNLCGEYPPPPPSPPLPSPPLGYMLQSHYLSTVRHVHRIRPGENANKPHQVVPYMVSEMTLYDICG